MGITGCGRHITGHDSACIYCVEMEIEERKARRAAEKAERETFKEKKREAIRNEPPSIAAWVFVVIAVTIPVIIALAAAFSLYIGPPFLIAGITLLIVTHWWPEKVSPYLVKGTVWRRITLIMMVFGGISSLIMIRFYVFSDDGTTSTGILLLSGIIFVIGAGAAWWAARKAPLQKGERMPPREKNEKTA